MGDTKALVGTDVTARRSCCINLLPSSKRPNASLLVSVWDFLLQISVSVLSLDIESAAATAVPTSPAQTGKMWPCAQQFVGKHQSCMVILVRLIPVANSYTSRTLGRAANVATEFTAGMLSEAILSAFYLKVATSYD